MSIKSTLIVSTLVILLAAVGSGLGQEKDQSTFKTAKPRQTQLSFKAKLFRIEKEHEANVAKARLEYLDQMELLQKQTTQAGNLEEAIRIRDEIANINNIKPLVPKAKSPTSKREALRRKLIGTRWDDPRFVREFKADHVVMGFKKTRQVLKFPWVVLTEDTIIIKVRSGYEIVMFDAAVRQGKVGFAKNISQSNPIWTRIK